MMRIAICTLVFVICFPIGAEDSEQSEAILFSKEKFSILFIESSDMVKSFKNDIAIAKVDRQIIVAGNFPRLSFVFGTGPHPEYIYHPNKLEKISGEDILVKENWEKHPYDISK